MLRKIVTLAAALAVSALAQVPRPEHPQPQFQREQWQTLNGPWEFEFDDANAGLDAAWETSAKKFSRTITVPYCFESKLSGIADTSFHPWVWYRRTLTVPAAWKGKRTLLHFGAVDYQAMVWVNGRFAGRHEGGSTPFVFDVTPLLQSGANTVTVRAWDPPTDRSIPRGKQYWEPKSRSIFYTRTSGIWQSVWIEAVAATYLERVRITPANDGPVRFDAFLANPQPGMELRTVVSFGQRTIAETVAPATGAHVGAGAYVSDPRLWSPASPNLYDVTFELRQGQTVLDRVTSYFGFRSVGTEGNRITLNGRPYYVKMVLDQGYWPESILTPPSDAAIQYDIRLTKEMGFNGARKHQKLEDPRFLYWADRMGFLVSSEAANSYLFDEQYVERFTREWMESVDRDYNHPSIVMWVPINESWGVPNLHDPRQQQHLRALYTLTRSMDATRPVIDNDGWEHSDMTDIFAVHNYARTGGKLYDIYKAMLQPGATPPAGSRESLAPGFKYNGSPVALTEFGGIAYIPAGAQVPAESWGYSGVEPSAEAALGRLRSLYEAIAKLPFAGICYTQITDVEQEINGLMTYDRKPKFDSKILRELNGMLK
jgi:beta-galactosidase/beta-glucuronidase